MSLRMELLLLMLICNMRFGKYSTWLRDITRRDVISVHKGFVLRDVILVCRVGTLEREWAFYVYQLNQFFIN